jgi:hypothetical protein
VNVEWAMLANYAEDNGGLLNLQGATWDTVTVGSPLVGGPPNVFAMARGFYVARLGFHSTETGRTHEFELRVVDADGAEIAKLEGEADVQRAPNIPLAWPTSVNLIVPVTGLPLPKPGEYSFHLLLDSAHQHSLPFRVIKGY